MRTGEIREIKNKKRGLKKRRRSSAPPGEAGEAKAQNEARTEGGVFTSCVAISDSVKLFLSLLKTVHRVGDTIL